MTDKDESADYLQTGCERFQVRIQVTTLGLKPDAGCSCARLKEIVD